MNDTYYEILADDSKEVNGVTVYRIRATKQFCTKGGIIYPGALGGYVQSMENLSDGWIDYDSTVYGNVNVSGRSYIEKSEVGILNNDEPISIISSRTAIRDSVITGYVYALASLIEHSTVNTCRIDSSSINKSTLSNARIEYSTVDGAIIKGAPSRSKSLVSNCNSVDIIKSEVYGVVGGYTNIRNTVVRRNTDLTKDILESIRLQVGLIPFKESDGKYYVIAYKQVDRNMCSLWDETFKYTVGDFVSVEDCVESIEPCANGLHFSHANYFIYNRDAEESIFLTAKICVDDIITVSDGKIRCRKAFIMDGYTAADSRDFSDMF